MMRKISKDIIKEISFWGIWVLSLIFIVIAAMREKHYRDEEAQQEKRDIAKLRNDEYNR